VIEYVFNGTSKGLGQTSTQIGFAFPFTLNAFNAGYSDAGDTTAEIYLTNDPNNVTGGTYIGTFDFGYLGTYTYTVQTPNITIPTYVTPGTYYVGYLLNATNGQYGTDNNTVVIEAQTMNAYCNADAYEPDNVWSQASTLTNGSIQNHSLCPQTEQDWATFTLPQSSSASLTTEGFTGGDTTMTLYDANLNQVDFNDDNGRDLYSTINRVCGTNPLAAGTYYVQIQAYAQRAIIPNYTLSFGTSVCPVATTTVLASSKNPSYYGNSVTFTATVTSGGGTPTGSLTFYDGTTSLGTHSLFGGIAKAAISSLGAGSHSITAAYAGNSSWIASTSPVLTQTVNKVATTTALTTSAKPAPYKTSLTFTATVSSSTTGTPTGTVVFKDGTTALAQRTLSGGTATLVISSLAVGPHSITAVYGADTNFARSTSSAISENITKAATSTVVTSSLNPSTHGTAVTFTAQVESATAGIPTGSVTFKDGTTALAVRTLGGAGKATFTTSSLSVGSHSITAVYGSDANYIRSTSPVLTQQVNQ
jgi:hypothetical protein